MKSNTESIHKHTHIHTVEKPGPNIQKVCSIIYVVGDAVQNGDKNSLRM